jgi:hypothetical protein
VSSAASSTVSLLSWSTNFSRSAMIEYLLMIYLCEISQISGSACFRFG